MAAQSLSSFVVGIGYEMDQRSERQVGASFDRLKKRAAGIVGALTGAGVAATAFVNKFATVTDDMGAFARAQGISIERLNAMQLAFEQNSASAEGLRSVMQTLTDARTSLLKGDGAFFEGWALSDVPAFLADITDAGDRVTALARYIQGLGAGSEAEKRVAGELGLDYRQLEALRSNFAASTAENMAASNLRGSDLADSREFLTDLHNFQLALTNLGRAAARAMDGPLGELLRLMTKGLNAIPETMEEGQSIWQRMFDGGMGGATGGSRNRSKTEGPKVGSVYLDGKTVGKIVFDGAERQQYQQGLEFVGAIS